MTARRSPLLPDVPSSVDLILAVDTLENSPSIPFKTPGAADGYDGEICRDDTRLYLFTGGIWTYITLTPL